MAHSVSDREEFLKNRWSRYPVKPSEHTVAGQILSCGAGHVHLRLSPTEVENFQISESWQRILREGDWISLKTDATRCLEICLLAPNLSGSAPSPISPQQLGILSRWSEFQNLVREFFLQEGFAEVQTPTLTVCPGTEPFLDVFETQFQWGKINRKLFLPTSPELHLKKALGRGIPKLFEMRPCFRNGEVSATHQPEFWMLEWYRAFENLDTIKSDVENLVNFLIHKMKLEKEFARPIERSISELFQKHCGFSLTPKSRSEDLLQVCKSMDIQTGQATDFDDLFYFLFLEKIEGNLKHAGPLFVEKYPPSQAALARLTADGWGDRFEFYWGGFEIANAFHELNDPQVQKERFAQDLSKKVNLGKTPVPVDDDFVACLEVGLPPSAGIALGLERLFMVLMDISDIKELRLFPIEAEPERLF
jgi:elongation factor P--(R)-beta-lysine ligase